MDNQDIKARMKETVERHLNGRASRSLTARLFQLIDESRNDANQIDDGLNKIRITIKLFVDENLSDQVYRELRSMAESS